MSTPSGRTTADRLHDAALRLMRRMRKHDESVGISTARLSVLSVLAFVGPRSVTSLAAIEQVRQPTMTHLVDALARDGLARRRPDADDGRVSIVEITSRGRSLIGRARRRRIEELTRMLATLDRTERTTLRRAADLIRRMLDD